MPRRPEVLLGRIVDAFRTLLRVVESEPELVAFLPAARELYGQVRALHRGEREIPKFSKGGAIPIMDVIPQLPSKDAALLLLGPIDRIPGAFPGEDDPALVRAYQRILGNMTLSMMSAILRQYPEIVPGLKLPEG